MTKDPNIVLTGYIDVPVSRLEAVRSALPDHIALTRAEPGCLSFHVEEDPNTAGRYNVSERFTDRVSFDAHQTRMKASRWATVTAGIPRHYTVTEVPA